MAGRCHRRERVPARRNRGDVCAADSVRRRGDAGPLLLRGATIGKLQSGICAGGTDVLAGIFIVHIAAPDVRVFVLCGAADCAGVVPEGSELATVADATTVPVLGEYARVVHYRDRSVGGVFVLRAEFVSVREHRGDCVDPEAEDAAGAGAAGRVGGAAADAVRDTAGSLSV